MSVGSSPTIQQSGPFIFRRKGPTKAVLQKEQRPGAQSGTDAEAPETKGELNVCIKVGGRLRFFISAWEKFTKDKFILQCVEGYKIPFRLKPRQKFFVNRSIKSPAEIGTLEVAIRLLEEKGAVIRCKHSRGQFLSSFFVVPKPDGSSRFIINLKKLNKYIRSILN